MISADLSVSSVC